MIIAYEDSNIIIVQKEAGQLTQSGKSFDLDLTTPYNSDAEYMSVISSRPSACYVADSATTFDLVGQIVVNGSKNSLGVNGYKITYTGERTTYTSDNYLPYFRIEKIEGYK